MSRSKKHNPIVTDKYSAKRDRQIANKKIRRKYHYNDNDEDIIQGSDYKKLYEQWLIHDWVFKYTLEELLDEWYIEEIEEQYTGYPGPLHRGSGTLKNLLRWWKTRYLYR